MNNRYSSLKKVSLEEAKIKQKEILKLIKNKRNVLAQNVDFRRKEWLDQIANNKDYRNFYNEGAIKLSHPDLIEFRDRDRNKEKLK